MPPVFSFSYLQVGCEPWYEEVNMVSGYRKSRGAAHEDAPRIGPVPYTLNFSLKCSAAVYTAMRMSALWTFGIAQ